MRKMLLSGSALALLLGAAPAAAMCGGMGQQAQASTQGSMMCGRPSTSTQAEDPFGLKQGKPQQSGMGMCPCCRGMAMMQGGGMQGGEPQAEDPHKGMDMSPKQ